MGRSIVDGIPSSEFLVGYCYQLSKLTNGFTLIKLYLADRKSYAQTKYFNFKV